MDGKATHLLIPGLAGVMVVLAYVPILIVMFVAGPSMEDTTQGGGVAIPAEYVEIVGKAAGRCEMLTPARLAAQIQQESGWNPRASSPAGALGIAQFMPGTWAAHGEDGNGDGTVDVFDPDDAIWSMGGLMCSLGDSIQPLIDSGSLTGDVWELSLAAYNAGLGAVQDAGGIPDFAETRHYVEAIKALAEAGFQGGSSVVTKGIWGYPLPDLAPVTSPFGMRIHPIQGVKMGHTGVDLGAPCGTPALATHDGIVTVVSYHSLSGNYVMVDYGTINGTSYRAMWLHLSAQTVKEGQHVTKGQQVGLVGTTGSSTGCHLHYEFHVNGVEVDPEPYW